MNLKTLVAALVLFCIPVAQSVAQVKATIKGPSQVLAGALLFLSHEDAVGDTKLWVIPDELKEMSASCGANIFFSIPKPGVYTFQLIVAQNGEKAPDVAYAFHKVTVVGSVPPTDPPPTTPPTPGSLQALISAHKKGLGELDDPATTAALYNAIRSVIQSTPPGTPLGEAKTNMSMAIERTLAARPRELFRTKFWIQLWRVPVNDEFVKLNIQTTEQYFAVYQELLK